LLLLAIFLGRKPNHIDQATEQSLSQALLDLPSQMNTMISRDACFIPIINTLKSINSFVYLGRGVHYPLALEGALKMKELAYRPAHGYPAGEMKHGPLALIDQQMCVIGLSSPGSTYQKMLTNLEEVHARGGKLIIIGSDENKQNQSLAQHVLHVPSDNEYLHAILSAVPLQFIAYHLACSLGYHVDRPKNLAKSVTVE